MTEVEPLVGTPHRDPDWMTLLQGLDDDDDDDSDSDDSSDSSESSSSSSSDQEEQAEDKSTPSSWNSEKHRADILQRLNGHGLATLLDMEETDSDDEEGEVSSDDHDKKECPRKTARRKKKKAVRRKRRAGRRTSKKTNAKACAASTMARDPSVSSMPDLASCTDSMVDHNTADESSLNGSFSSSLNGSVRDFVMAATQSHSSGTWLGSGWEDGLESLYGLDDDNTILTSLTKQGVIIEGMPTPEPVKPAGKAAFDVHNAVNYLTQCAQAAGIGQDEVVNILERLIAEHDARAKVSSPPNNSGPVEFSIHPSEMEHRPPVELEVQRPVEFEVQRPQQEFHIHPDLQLDAKVPSSVDGTADTSPLSKPDSSETMTEDSDHWQEHAVTPEGGGALPKQPLQEFSLMVPTGTNVVSAPSRAEPEEIQTIPSNPPFTPSRMNESFAPSPSAVPSQPTMPVPRQMLDPFVPEKRKSLFQRVFGCLAHATPV